MTQTLSPAATRPQRERVWDAASGLAIFAVVVIHASGHSVALPAGSDGFWFGMVLRQCCNFAVAFFLARAGLMAARSFRGSGGEFLRARFSRLLPPYLIWSTAFVMLRHRADLMNPLALFGDYVAGSAIGIGYFVVALAQFTLLTPLLRRLSTAAHFTLLIVLTLAGLTFNYAVQLDPVWGQVFVFPYYALPFFAWYPSYHLGFVAARFRLAAPMRWLVGATIALLVFLLLSELEAARLIARGLPAFATSQLKFTSLAFACAFFVAVLAIAQMWPAAGGAVLAWLGERSYYIYLTHLLVLPLFVRGLARSGAAEPLLVFGAALGCALVIAASALVLERLTPAWARRLIGL